MKEKNINIGEKAVLGLLCASILLTGFQANAQGAKTLDVKPTSIVTSTESFTSLMKKKANILLEEGDTNSIQYAIIDNGKILASDVMGKYPEKLSKDTIYGVGSVSKVFAAAAVMKLVDDGKLDLDTPVYKYITDFKMKDERYQKITPRMLLNHSSGLRGDDVTSEILLDDNNTYAHDNLLKALSEQTLKAEPGAFSVYCNSGFSLSELLVERVSGISFTEFLDTNFMKPLGMKNSGTPQSSLNPKQFTRFYLEDGSMLPRLEYCNAIGSGGVLSTAEDMIKFSEVFMGKHKDLLSDASVKKMESEEYKLGMWPGDVDDSGNYGLGWDSVKMYPFSEYGIKALSKGGDISTTHAIMIVLPEKNMSAVVLTSGGSSGSNQAFASEMLITALKNKGEIKEIKKDKGFGKPIAIKMPKSMLENAGTYLSNEGRFQVSITNDGKLSFSNEPENSYTYIGNGKFVDDDGNNQIQFVNEKNKKTYIWKQNYTKHAEFPQMADSQYIGEKLVKNKIPEKLKNIWSEREDNMYYIVNERYTSDSYIMGPIGGPIEGVDTELGYFGDKKIVDENTAISEVQIPGMMGRDTAEAKIVNKDGIEYMHQSGYIAINEEFITPLKLGSKIKIKEDGYAVWHKIPKDMENETLTVKIPKESGFVVYDADDNLVLSSYVYGKNSVVLPEDGKIVFAGKIGSEFQLTLK